MVAEMDDVRCPMCGRLNPAHLEVCQYCEARLKPLRLSPEEQEENEAPEEIRPDTGGVTDWLRSLAQEGEEAASRSTSEDDSLDWLKELKGEQEIEAEDFFERLDSTIGEPDTQDWSDRIGGREEPLDEERKIENLFDERALPPREEDETQPEWLLEMRASYAESPLEAPIEEECEESPGEPPLPQAFATEDAAALQSAEAAYPDWYLDSKEAKEAEEEQPSIAPEDEEAKHILPITEQPLPEEGFEGREEEAEWVLEEWIPYEEEGTAEPSLSEEFQASQPQASGAVEESKLEEASPPPLEEVFDASTLAEDVFAPGEGEAKQATGEELPSEPSAAPEVEQTGLPSIELPDWLLDSGVSENGLEVPDWLLSAPQPLDVAAPLELSVEEPEAVAKIEAEEREEFLEAGLSEIEAQPSPDWLEGTGEGVQAEQLLEKEGLPGPEERLEQAEIPAWLKPMQPIESVTKGIVIEEDDARVEPAGPLAGLKGVLPAEPEIALPREPSAYNLKLQVTERQQAHAQTLKKLIEEEGLVKPLPQEAFVSPQHILRLFIAFSLFLAILFPMVMSFPMVERPPLSESALAASQIVNRLSEGDPVLVVVDYQAGYAGELDAVVSSVFDHLMIRGAFITLVSTSPLGALQAERLIATTNRNYQHDYRREAHYLNLGYIPGGTAGLRSFAEQPRLTLPLTIEGTMAWSIQALASVNQLSDFRAIIVATEASEIARAWIEQTQAHLGATPLLFVVGAQTQPSLLPYAQQPLPQITVLLSGLSGGVSYEQATGRTKIYDNRWASFSLGGILIISLILIGSVANLIAALFRANTPGKKAEGGSL